MTIKCQNNSTKDRTNKCSSFIVFVDCFVYHFLTLLLSDVVFRFDLIHPVRHLVNYSSGPVARLL